MDEYLQAIYDYLAEKVFYDEMKKQRSIRDLDEQILRKQDELRNLLTREQWLQSDRCCALCNERAAEAQEVVFELGVAVGKYMAK